MRQAQPSVAIVYGFAEGKWHSRKLRHELECNGYSITTETSQADIIIAHSGGCLLLPPHSARLVLLVNFAYWPDRSLRASMSQLLGYERKLPGQTLPKWVWECIVHDIHMCNLPQTFRLKKQWASRKIILSKIDAARLIFVRNRDDSYSSPQALLNMGSPKATYLTYPRGHNDLWRNPAAYINLVQSEQKD